MAKDWRAGEYIYASAVRSLEDDVADSLNNVTPQGGSWNPEKAHVHDPAGGGPGGAVESRLLLEATESRRGASLCLTTDRSFYPNENEGDYYYAIGAGLSDTWYGTLGYGKPWMAMVRYLSAGKASDAGIGQTSGAGYVTRLVWSTGFCRVEITNYATGSRNFNLAAVNIGSELP